MQGDRVVYRAILDGLEIGLGYSAGLKVFPRREQLGWTKQATDDIGVAGYHRV